MGTSCLVQCNMRFLTDLCNFKGCVSHCKNRNSHRKYPEFSGLCGASVLLCGVKRKFLALASMLGRVLGPICLTNVMVVHRR